MAASNINDIKIDSLPDLSKIDMTHPFNKRLDELPNIFWDKNNGTDADHADHTDHADDLPQVAEQANTTSRADVDYNESLSNLKQISEFAKIVAKSNFPPEQSEKMQTEIKNHFMEELEKMASSKITAEYLRKRAIDTAFRTIKEDIQLNFTKNIMSCDALFPSDTSKEFLELLGHELTSKNYFIKPIGPRIIRTTEAKEYVGFKVSIFKFND